MMPLDEDGWQLNGMPVPETRIGARFWRCAAFVFGSPRLPQSWHAGGAGAGTFSVDGEAKRIRITYSPYLKHAARELATNREEAIAALRTISGSTGG